MIKVNLLREQTVRTRKSAVRPTASPMGFLALGVLLFVAVGLGAAWYYLHSQVVELTGSRDNLRVANARLQGLRAQIDQYENMKRERQSRIDIIEQLKTNQTGPVLLLNHVLHSIPTSAALWLTSLDQKGDQVRITGFTVNGASIPDFMSNLSGTGFFRTVDLELYEDQEKEPAKFTLLCISDRRSGGKAPTE
jgi:Tfp pilus assembly protein PilN